MRLLSPLLVALLVSCGGTRVRDAALSEDLPTFKQALLDAQKRGELSEATVKSVAHAVIERELASSKGDAVVARVRDVRACIGPVEGLLDELSERRDAGGGAALLALVDTGRVDGDDLVTPYEKDADPMFRAVAARAAVGTDHGLVRRRFIADPDLRVRRAALYAARETADAEDVEVLAEAARLDPDALCRSIAIQALGAIGGERVVQLLIDLWGPSDLSTRQGIVEAFAKPKTYDAGGMARLLSTMETEPGIVRVVAARGLMESESEHRGLARSVLTRAAEFGPADERRLALSWLPLDEEGKRVLLQAQKSEDASVSVAAAARLVAVPQHADAAAKSLSKHQESEQTSVRRAAEAALANAGDRRVLDALRRGLEAKDPEERRHAAVQLLALGEYSTAAPGLADEVARVRTQVACAVLARR